MKKFCEFFFAPNQTHSHSGQERSSTKYSFHHCLLGKTKDCMCEDASTAAGQRKRNSQLSSPLISRCCWCESPAHFTRSILLAPGQIQIRRGNLRLWKNNEKCQSCCLLALANEKWNHHQRGKKHGNKKQTRKVVRITVPAPNELRSIEFRIIKKRKSRS